MTAPDGERKDAVEVEITASDARVRLTELVNRAEFGGERFKITRYGKTIGAIVGVTDYGRLTAA
jgi:prevent-host-death family protein